MSSIGERLREERLRRGLTIEQIAEQTKINPALLEAVENDRFDRMPGAFFTRAFIRQYAAALELEPERLEPELSQLTGYERAPVAEPDPEFRPQIERGSVRGGIGPPGLGLQNPLGAAVVFVVILAACSGLYALWERSKAGRSEEERAAATLPTAVPTPAQPTPTPTLLPSPTPADTAAPAEPGTEAPAQPGQEAPADPNASAAAPTEAAPASAAPPQPPPAAPEAAATAAVTGPVRLQIKANAMTWLRLTAGGKLVFEGVLNANDARVFQSQLPMLLRTGNAGGLDIVWNGKAAGPFGRVGDVRTVEFSPDSFRVVPPPPPATPPTDLP